MAGRREERNMSEKPEWKPEQNGPNESGVGPVLRGCGIALGIALLILAFIVGQCFL